MFSFKKLNFIRFDWALIVLIGYCIAFGQCSPSTNRVTAATPVDVNAEFKNFMVDLERTMPFPYPISQSDFLILPTDVKLIFLKSYQRFGNAKKAFDETMPQILNIMTRKWAAEKNGNWNLEALAREFEGELDSLSIWEITSPLFYYLSPDPKNPSRSKFSSMFDVPIQRNQEKIINKFKQKELKKKTACLTEVATLILYVTTVYESQLERQKAATLTPQQVIIGRAEKPGTVKYEDALNRAERICRQRNIPIYVESNFNKLRATLRQFVN